MPLEAGWAWLREEPQGWRVEQGSLEILAQPGHVFAKYNDARNVLLRKAPESAKAWSVEVFVESRPTTQFEEATLYYYLDDDNYVGLFREQLGNGTYVRMIREQAGTASFLFEKKYDAPGVWFRLVVDGTKATGFYRQTENDPWLAMSRTELPAKDGVKAGVKVGVNASGGPKGTNRWAKFRDFRVRVPAE
ncbi:MAG: hypothetical protein K8U03_07665 [Planctomycetia bacterium]|nr:hypothetical protein [Planctomycetia bacterium]